MNTLARTPTNRNKTKRKPKKTNKVSYELIGILFVFSAILGISKLGFAGVLMANFFRFFFGELFILPLAMFGVYGLYLLIMGREPRLRKQYVLAISLLLLAGMLFLHAQTFQHVMASEGSLFQITLMRFLSDVRTSVISGIMGGGMIGAILYQCSHFLVSQWGTYTLVAFMVFFAVCTLFGMDTHDVMTIIRKIAMTIYGGLYRIFNPLFINLKSAISDKASQMKQVNQKPSVVTDNGRFDSVEDTEDESTDESEGWFSRTKNKIKKEATAVIAEDDISLDSEPKQTRLTIDSYQKETDTKTVLPTPKATAAPSEDQQAPEAEEDEDNGEVLDFEITEETENRDYQLPPVSLLKDIPPTDQSSEYAIIENNVKVLEETFESFGVDATVRKANLGPAVTKYEIQPAVGVKVSKIVNLADDLALALAAKDIRIEAPIPGKSFIGIEVPNSEVSTVSFRSILDVNHENDKLLEVPLGRDISGVVQYADLTKMPHLLIAGATGSGKSVAINGIITSILMKAKPNEVKMMMIDPKKVELNVYNGVPHLLTPVVTNPRKAAQALHKVVAEMERRYELFAGTGMRNIDGYNELIMSYNVEKGENNPTLPYIVVIVDELADLMMVASNEVEDAITRLAQMARAAGIHMILATQRPSVDVITGIIKANVPSRIAFAVSSSIDSRTIIDGSGAEKLLGRGDMLFRPMGENKPRRVQGAFISDWEVENVVTFVKEQQEPNYVEEMMQLEPTASTSEEPEDEYFEQALEFIIEEEAASISKLQRKFRIGYNRAARIIDDMEARGYVGPADGSKPRKVNVTFEMLNESSDSEPQ